MRSLTDTFLLLRYVEKNPEYIKRFMEKEGRGVNISQLKKEVQDQNLTEYYNFLSDMIHSNPSGIKMTYYISTDGEAKMISTNLLNQEQIYEQTLISLIYILRKSHAIIRNIYSISWNPNSKIIQERYKTEE